MLPAATLSAFMSNMATAAIFCVIALDFLNNAEDRRAAGRCFMIGLLTSPMPPQAAPWGLALSLFVLPLSLCAGNCIFFPLDTVPTITCAHGYYIMGDLQISRQRSSYFSHSCAVYGSQPRLRSADSYNEHSLSCRHSRGE